ncbi:MAG: class I adenylate-forming enzyme family protein [Chloroflexota bacterium]
MIVASAIQIEEYERQGWWGRRTIFDLFQNIVHTTPDAVALVDPANRTEFTGGNFKRLTYSQLAEKVNCLAAGLLRCGVNKDDIVMVQLPNVAELIIAYLAVARIGAIISPVPVQYRTHELRQVIGITRPKLFITTENFMGHNYVEMVQSIQAEFPSLTNIIGLGDHLPTGVISLNNLLDEPYDAAALEAYVGANPVNANECFTICWTSGTEAEPKGVPRSYNHWITIAYATVDAAELDPGCTVLNPFPMVNMSAIGGMLVPWLLTGGKLVMHQPLNLAIFLKQIEEEQINYTVAPPVLMNLLLMKPALLENTNLSSIKNLGSGSSPLSPWMTTQWKERYGINVLNFFGSNEGTSFVSAPVDIPDAAERARFFPRYGVPGYKWTLRFADAISTKLVDPLTKAVITEPDISGEMAIKSPAIFSGYYERPDLTEQAFDADGYFYTGDLFAIAGESGDLNRYRFVGRLKDIIIRAGMKISPEEIESLIQEHPAVAEVAVLGVEDRRVGEEQVFAVVVFKPDQKTSLSEIHDFLKTKDIAAYKLPKKLVIVESMPRNPVGKILKRVLKEKIQMLLADQKAAKEYQGEEIALPV